jgi:hypothetical protein
MFNHHLIKRSLAAAVVIAAASFPATAQARVSVYPPAGSGPPLTGAPSVSPTTSSSFQWGDAGIGAAGATVLLGVGALGAGMTRRRRAQRTIVG